NQIKAKITKPTAIPSAQELEPHKPTAGEANNSAALPDWFNSRPGHELKAALSSSKPLYLYIPWIAGHGDSVIDKIEHPEAYRIAPFDFVSNLDQNGTRLQVLGHACRNPALYRRMLIKRLVPLKGKIKGIIFTFDWSPVMRMISFVCEELGIPRILVPHESVFVDRDKYYWDVASKASTPKADV